MPERISKTSQILPNHVLFGSSRVMAEVRNQVSSISPTTLPVLLTGEGGTGKESIARWIHSNSNYAAGEFVKVNCAAIPGTDLDLNLQSKLLHFLQDGTFCRIGDDIERKIDFRLLCSTNKDLQAETDAGRFRLDLFYRIHVFRVRLPKLSQRREDVPALAEYFRQQFQTQFGTASQPLPPEILDYLQSLPWPGNIRELSNVIARYVLIGPEAMIDPEDRQRKQNSKLIIDQSGSVTLKSMARKAIKEVERNVILETLRANHWNRRKTAQELRISYRALIYKIRDAGLASRRRTSKNSPSANERSHQAPASD